MTDTPGTVADDTKRFRALLEHLLEVTYKAGHREGREHLLELSSPEQLDALAKAHLGSCWTAGLSRQLVEDFRAARTWAPNATPEHS